MRTAAGPPSRAATLVTALPEACPAAPRADARLPIDEIEAFLAVARELHFGRAAERMFISQSRVSRLVASLERRIGAMLFERTSRVVRLTPLADRLYGTLSEAHAAMTQALDTARSDARDEVGTVTVGFSPSAGRDLLNAVLDACATRCPECDIALVEVPSLDPYAALRAGDVEVLLTWFADAGADLSFGPVFADVERVLAVGRGHALATRSAISAEELADLPVARISTVNAITEVVSPSTTPHGRPITGPVTRGLHDTVALAARGHVVHPTVPGLADIAGPDIVMIPIDGMPPLQYGPVWLTARGNARIRKLALACEPLPV